MKAETSENQKLLREARVTFFACPKKVTKERAVGALQTYCFITAGIFRHAIPGVVEKRRASMRAALRVYESTGVRAAVRGERQSAQRESEKAELLVSFLARAKLQESR